MGQRGYRGGTEGSGDRGVRACWGRERRGGGGEGCPGPEGREKGVEGREGAGNRAGNRGGECSRCVKTRQLV